MSLCPCGSNTEYQVCCQPFHLGTSTAQTPQQLMASRYCAFVKAEARYLLDTHHPDFRNGLTEQELAEACGQTDWRGLQILDFRNDNGSGEVEFKAWYQQEGKLTALHERSNFQLIDGQWLYCDGTIYPAPSAPGRNEPCICNSGKKFKRCCG